MSDYTNLIRWEGKISHLYLDTVGKVTCGIGFQIFSISDLREFDWTPHLPAAEEDHARVLAQPVGKVARYYGLVCRAHMTEASIEKGALVRLARLRISLRNLGWPITPGTVDMAWNLGVRGLDRGYPKLKAALQRGDLTSARLECSRRGVSDARNDWTKANI